MVKERRSGGAEERVRVALSNGFHPLADVMSVAHMMSMAHMSSTSVRIAS